MATVLKRLSSKGVGLSLVQIGAYLAPSVTTGVVITGLTIANVLSGPSIVVTVQINDGSTAWNLVSNALVMQGGALTICDEGNRQVLNAGDRVFVFSNIAASCDVIMSVMEVS